MSSIVLMVIIAVVVMGLAVAVIGVTAGMASARRRRVSEPTPMIGPHGMVPPYGVQDPPPNEFGIADPPPNESGIADPPPAPPRGDVTDPPPR